MSVADITYAAGASMNAGQMDSVSGASTYVPPTTSETSFTDSSVAQMRSDIQQNSQNFVSLKSALNSNNLAGATQAYNTLQQDIQKASAANGGKSPFDPNSPIGKDFQAIGSALQAGDLSGAKQAFATFKTDIKVAGRTARAQNFEAASGTSDGATTDGGQTTATNPVNSATTVGGILDATA